FIIIPEPPQKRTFVPLSIKYHHVTVDIDNQIATTKVDQVFLNENNHDLEGIYIFPIPEDASISDFAMFVDGKRISAEVLDRKKASDIYEDIVRKMKDPALLEYMGRDAFRARVYPIPARGEKRIQLEYSEVLKYDSGLCKYIYPLNTEKFSAKPIPSVAVTVDIKTKEAIKTIYSPSHDVDIKKKDDHKATLSYEASNVKPDRDLTMYYTVSEDDVGLNLLTYREKDEDGFFILMVAPKYEISERDIIEKDILFILDKSGSMQGEKIEQAKDALKFCVNSLNKDDNFSIITFSTDVDEFNESLLSANQENLQKASRFIDKIDAKGGTNIDDALQKALSKDVDEDRPRVIVFLTDGLPTVGEKDVDKILKNVKDTRNKAIRMFTFGVGYDVNTHFLDNLSQKNGGTPQYVEPSEDIEMAVSLFYSKISEPVLSDLELRVDEIKVKEIYPRTMPDLFRGTQLLVMGRYEGNGRGDIEISGQIGDESKSYDNRAEFPRLALENSFIPRLWAQRKIGYLLEEIRSQGENDELKDEIIRLSKEYGIITPYTSFLVMPDEEEQEVPVALRYEMRRNALESASAGIKAKRGRNAVAASKTMRRLKEAKAAPQSSPVVTSSAKPDSSWKYGAADSAKYNSGEVLIKYVGKKTFFFKSGFWTDSIYETEMETIDISYGSDEYFELLTGEAEIAKYLALGQKVIVCYKEKCYRIE
ncbi:VWA domain-containing protein, partial [Candidatus Poribacteria bacterium]|nr:VWA domain-containing protein [Candidatus Poribacteria bacterium]